MVTTAMIRSLSFILSFGFQLCGVLFRTLATKAQANTPSTWGPRQPRTVSSLTQEATASPRVVNPTFLPLCSEDITPEGQHKHSEHRLLTASLVLHPWGVQNDRPMPTGFC